GRHAGARRHLGEGEPLAGAERKVAREAPERAPAALRLAHVGERHALRGEPLEELEPRGSVRGRRIVEAGGLELCSGHRGCEMRARGAGACQERVSPVVLSAPRLTGRRCPPPPRRAPPGSPGPAFPTTPRPSGWGRTVAPAARR